MLLSNSTPFSLRTHTFPTNLHLIPNIFSTSFSTSFSSLLHHILRDIREKRVLMREYVDRVEGVSEETIRANRAKNIELVSYVYVYL